MGTGWRVQPCRGLLPQSSRGRQQRPHGEVLDEGEAADIPGPDSHRSIPTQRPSQAFIHLAPPVTLFQVTDVYRVPAVHTRATASEDHERCKTDTPVSQKLGDFIIPIGVKTEGYEVEFRDT